jgi:two-component system, cell cycle response regulator
MLQSVLMSGGLDSECVGTGEVPRLGWVPGFPGQAESPGAMKRRITELLLLSQFNSVIGALLDPNQVCAAACSWLKEVVRWEVFTVSLAEGEIPQFHYHVLGVDVSVSKICPDLTAGVGAATANCEGGPSDWSESGEDVISIVFPNGSGKLAVSRKSVLESQFSDEFLAGIADSIARALSNARECARLKTLSMRDHLTGLYNRRVFEAMLEVEARKRTRNPFSLLLIDLDNLQSINDSHGHGTGDDVLISVAKMLLLNFRKADVPARYGGDEFAVLLPEASLDSARRGAERFRQSVTTCQFDLGSSQIVPTVSVGVAAVSDRQNLQVSHMVEEADQALYRAKTTGRNRVCAAHLDS